jgi:hypothetical protein
MRTTLTIEDRIVQELKALAQRSGKPFKQVVNEALRAGLVWLERAEPKPYRLEPASLGRVPAGLDLDKALALADRLEDEAISAKPEQRK